MSLNRGINLAITSPKEVAFIREMMVPLEDRLLSLEETIATQRRSLQISEVTIKTLAARLDHAMQLSDMYKRDLATHMRDLSALDEFQARLKDEDARFEEYLDNMPSFLNQTAQKTADLSKITFKIAEMREVMHSQRIVQRASKEQLHGLECYKESTVRTIAHLNSAFSPIHKVPAECWVIIFRYSTSLDNGVYLASPYNPPALPLSQVCTFWRQIVHREGALWGHFVCSPSFLTSKIQMERWEHFISLSQPGFTFLTDLRAGPSPSTSMEQWNKARDAMSSVAHSIHLLCGDYTKALAAVDTLPFKGQSSMTLELGEPVTVVFFNNLEKLFPSLSTLRLISTPRLPVMHPTPWKRGQAIQILIMDLTDFDPFRIDYYCNEGRVKELHVRHNGNCLLQGRRTMACWQLRILGITPPETNWFRSHKLPFLHRLILYGPKLRTVDAPSLVELSEHADFHRVRELELEKWPTYEPENTPSWSIMPLILKIVDKLRFVETIRCTDSFIEGKILVALVKSLKSDNPKSTPSKLKTVIINCCTGITRYECELIAASVEKLVVYV